MGTFSSTNLQIAILVVVFVYFSADYEQSPILFRFSEGRARASVR